MSLLQLVRTKNVWVLVKFLNVINDSFNKLLFVLNQAKLSLELDLVNLNFFTSHLETHLVTGIIFKIS